LQPARTAARANEARVRLAVARAALETETHAQLDEARARLGIAAAALDALSPLAVLRRGYALAEDVAGRTLREASAVHVGAAVRVRLAEGALRCRVEAVEDFQE